MPEIAPATPLIPAVSAPAAPAGPAAPSATMLTGGTAQDFLGQLKAALKSLAGAIPVLPVATTQPPAVKVDLNINTTTDVAAAPGDQPTPLNRTSDQPSAEVMEILATLGFTLAPVPQPIVTKTGDPAPARVAADSKPMINAPVAQAQPLSAQGEVAQTAPAADGQIKLDSAMTLVTPSIAKSVPTETPTTPAPTQTTTPDANVRTDAAAATSLPQTAASESQPQAPTAVTPAALAAATVQPHLQNGGGASQQHSGSGAGDNHNQHSAGGTARVGAETTEETPSAAPVVDQSVVASAANAVATAPTPPVDTANIHPGHVVSQIAQQADLYRLPGNKGVRIQLHPDDLGGVQVTVRYATGGGLELHINVEHAATGALVEAGWSQLRDALATQGFSPDRLVMSVTGPASANQMDFSSNSSNNGGYRSDAGLAAFTQGGQSGQQQQGAPDESVGRRGWNTGSGEPRTSDDQPRAASNAISSASRIDYRV